MEIVAIIAMSILGVCVGCGLYNIWGELCCASCYQSFTEDNTHLIEESVTGYNFEKNYDENR